MPAFRKRREKYENYFLKNEKIMKQKISKFLPPPLTCPSILGLKSGLVAKIKKYATTHSCVATSLAFYRSQEGLSLENSEKSLKRGSRGLLAPGSKNPKKESKTTTFQVFFRVRPVFNLFSTFFELFRPRCREAPGTPFRTFSEFSRKGKAFLTPVEGQRCRNSCAQMFVSEFF